MHRLDQRLDVLGRRELRHAVAEVEDMPGTGSKVVQDVLRFPLDRRRRREKGHGIEVALQRDLRADTAARIGEARLPIDAERVGARCGHRLEPLPAALGEEDARHDATVLHARERGEDLLRVGE